MANVTSLFFKNIGIRQTIVKNTLWLVSAEVASRFLEIVLVIYITRILGPTEFGRFAFVLAFVSVFAMVSDFGLGTIATRQLAQDQKAEKEYSAILSLKIILSAVALILMIMGSFFITVDPVIRKLVWILSCYAILDHFFFIIYALLRARQQMQYEAMIKVFQSILIVVIGFFVIFKFPSIINVGYGYLIANVIALCLVLWFIHVYIFNVRLQFDKNLLAKFFKFSWPIGVASVFGAMVVNIDSIIMGNLGKITEVGWYNTAKSVIGFAIIPSTLITMSFYPVLAKFFKESKEKFHGAWNYYMESMVILALPITVGGFLLSSQIIGVMYGSSFGPSISALRMLIFSAGISLLYAPYLTVLIVADQQKKYLWINIIGAVVNAILNFALIPLYGLYGASAVAIITYLIMAFGSIVYFKKITSFSFLSVKLLKIMVISIISSMIMAIAISQLLTYNFSIIFIIPAGVFVYFTSWIIFGKIRKF